MNWELIKHKFCRLVVTASLLLGGVMVSACIQSLRMEYEQACI